MGARSFEFMHAKRTRIAKIVISLALLSGISAFSGNSSAHALVASTAVQSPSNHAGIAEMAPNSVHSGKKASLPALRGFKRKSTLPQIISYPSPLYMTALTNSIPRATSNTGNTPLYGIYDSGTAGCWIDATKAPYLFALKDGTCSLYIYLAPTGDYAAADLITQVIFTLSVPQVNFAADFSHSSTTSTVDISGTATVGNYHYVYDPSELHILIDPSSTSVCSASANIITAYQNGTCAYSVSVPNHGLAYNYLQTNHFQVTWMKSQVISYPDSLNVQPTNYNSLPLATTNAPTAVSYRIVDPGSAQCVTIPTPPYFGTHNVGSCTIALDAPAAPGWLAATKTVSITFSAIQPTLTISLDKSTAATTGTARLLIQGYNQSAIHLTVNPGSAGVCSASGTVISGFSNGTCSLSIAVDGNVFYLPSSASYSFPVDWTQSQTINFPDALNISYPNTSVETVTVSGRGTPVFRVLDPGTAQCYLATSQPLIRANQPGNCSIEIDAPATPGWQFTSKVVPVTFARVAPQINVTTNSSAAAQNGLVTISVTKNTPASALISVADSSASICSLNGNTLTTYANGSCIFTVSVPAIGFFTSATSTVTLNVTWVKQQIITFADSLNLTALSSSIGVATSNSNNPVTYSIHDAGTAQCSISPVQPFVRASHVGNCSLEIDVAASAGWASATKVVPVTFTGINPVLNIALDTSSVATSGYATISVAGYQPSEISVTADSGQETICSGFGNLLAAYKNQLCTYTVHVAASGLWNALTVSQSTQVNWVQNQVITYPGNGTITGLTTALNRPTSSDGKSLFTYAVTDPIATAKCSVDSQTGALSVTALGTCTVRIDSAAAPGWATASTTVVLSIVPTAPALQLWLDDTNARTTKYGTLSLLGFDNNLITSLVIANHGTAECFLQGRQLHAVTWGTCAIEVKTAPSGLWLAGDAVSTKAVTWWGFTFNSPANP